MSARPSRLGKEPSFGGWNASPSISRIGITQDHRWQSTPRAPKIPDSPEKSRKSAILPGFQNAFMDSAPSQSQVKSEAPISPRKSLMEKLKESKAAKVSPPPSPTVTQMENAANADTDMPIDNFDVDVDDVASGHTEAEDISMEDAEEDEDEEDDSFRIDYPDEVRPFFCGGCNVLKALC